MPIRSASGNPECIWILYTSEPAQRLADFIRQDLEWLLEMKISPSEPAPAGAAPRGSDQVIVTILLTPYMETAWRAVIHSMKRGLSKSACADAGGRLILRDRNGALKADFLFQSHSDLLGIRDSISVLMTT